jgi:hypothetical protein
MKKLIPLKKMAQERTLNLVKVNGDQWEYEDSFGNPYVCVRQNGHQSWFSTVNRTGRKYRESYQVRNRYY